MVPDVRVAVRTVDRKIHRHPVAVGEPVRELPRQLQPLVGVQLMGQRDFDFPRHTGVLSLLRELRRIPQGRAIQSPFGFDAFGQDDLGVLHAATGGDPGGPKVRNPHTAIGPSI